MRCTAADRRSRASDPPSAVTSSEPTNPHEQDSQWLFRVAGMPPSNTPQILACLGMVLRLHGTRRVAVLSRDLGALPLMRAALDRLVGIV
ncbi:MAG TPA: hypothetical protein VN408_41990 [Actinoplanes sp.]|nr:hypothetical protein [Actinoplanes sp.]